MKYLIYSRAAQAWFKAPGQGLTDDQARAHRFTSEEADYEISVRQGRGLERHPAGDPPCEGRS